MNGPLLLDGAFGTCLWAEAEKRGIEKVSTWRYNTEQPKLLEDVIKAYAAAGSDIIYSNTFVATRPFLAAEGAADRLKDTIKSGIRLVKESADVKVAASFGPLSSMMEPYGQLTKAQVEDVFKEAIDIAYSEDPDIIVLETFFDLNMLEIAAKIAKETKLPLWCCMSFDTKGKTYLGDSLDSMIERLSPIGLSGIGLNCSVGPDMAAKLAIEFAEKTDIPVIVKPNSQDLNAAEFAKQLKPAFAKAACIGSCCGTNPEYIKAIKDELEKE